MADVETPPDELPDMAFEATSVPTDSDAAATVTDFLDYTEFLPSDLFRSLTLIGKLDSTYRDAAAKVHDLATTYGRLPSMVADERPDAQALRKQISHALDRAISCREAAYSEASRLSEVVERHSSRLTSIKRKLQALPKPPSRDPTPPPASTSPNRSKKTEADRAPRLKLHIAGRPRQGRVVVPGEVLPPGETGHEYYSDDSDELAGSFEASPSPDFDGKISSIRVSKTTKLHKQKVGRPPKVRPPGVMGTNVHSSVAGISTSNALALLTPPPADAKAGSKYRPWFRLTEYEMALLRKSMKKNAIWTPSDAMIRRELHRSGRGRENYEKAKVAAEAAGEAFIDEEPVDPSRTELAPGEVSWSQKSGPDEAALVNRGMRLNEAKKQKKKEQLAREQAARDAMEIDEASRKIAEAGDQFKTLFSRSTPKSASKKRKRDSDKDSLDQLATTPSRGSAESKRLDSPKKLKLSVPPPLILSPKASSRHAARNGSPTKTTLVTTTTQVALAPAGSSSPSKSGASRRLFTPGTATSSISTGDSRRFVTTTPTGVQPTAAHSRSRRSSVPPKSAPSTVVEAPGRRDLDRAGRDTPTANRPRSRGVGSAKAASAEPPASKRELRDLRRSSVTAESTNSPSAGHPRATRSGRRPAPGPITADEDGKGKISVGKRKAAPKKRNGAQRKDDIQKTVDDTGDDGGEDIDPDEPRYCLCGDVSYGTMIACENEECETEWFHLSCIGLDDIPPRRTKWFCPDCRAKFKINDKGNVTETQVGGRRR